MKARYMQRTRRHTDLGNRKQQLTKDLKTKVRESNKQNITEHVELIEIALERHQLRDRNELTRKLLKKKKPKILPQQDANGIPCRNPQDVATAF